MKTRKEIWIALVAVAALALFIWGVNYLKGTDMFTRQRSFYAVYPRIDGLLSSSPVTINGMKIGQVGEVRFMEDGSARILVEMLISNPIPIPANSVAVIASSDILGSKEVIIRLGDTTALASSGDTLIPELQSSLQEEVNKQVAPLKRKAEDLMSSIDSMVTIISMVLNEDMRASLEGSLGNIQQTIANLKHTTYNIDTLVSSQRNRMAGIITNVESISNNLRANNQTITTILGNMGRISDSLARADIAGTFVRANTVLAEVQLITQKIGQGEGSLGLLLEDERLYERLDRSARDLDLLLQDVRLNPHRYLHFSVLGRNPKNNLYVAPDTAR
ncbi:MAG TPA: MlaD family protein [Bacteroidales bacterium]|nr:MlaD family protein [Bacteroidales bacterium]